MIFLVKIEYQSFKFNDKNDAIIFAEIAKTHAADPDDCSVRVELLTIKEIED